jgi:hypothetical protein
VFSFGVIPQFIPPSIYNPVALSSYSLSVATTVVSTVLIAIRILRVSRRQGASRQPQIAMEIIIESAVLYSISALAYTSMLSPFAPSATYELYGQLFFAYMAVESHP